jgi:hypothetical protein
MSPESLYNFALHIPIYSRSKQFVTSGSDGPLNRSTISTSLTPQSIYLESIFLDGTIPLLFGDRSIDLSIISYTEWYLQDKHVPCTLSEGIMTWKAGEVLETVSSSVTFVLTDLLRIHQGPCIIS